jgi:hypothetical protein
MPETQKYDERYASPEFSQLFGDSLVELAKPETAVGNINYDTKFVYRHVLKFGEQGGDIESPDQDELGMRVVQVSTTELPSWETSPPGIINVKSSYINLEDGERIRIVDFILHDELDKGAEPLYLGAVATTSQKQDRRHPVVQYDVRGVEKISLWPQLSADKFNNGDENSSPKLKIAGGKPTPKETQLHALLCTLQDVSELFELQEEERTLEQTAMVGKFTLRNVLERLRGIS